MLDILILNGEVIDGTGNPPYPASVAIQGDRLVQARSLDGGAHLDVYVARRGPHVNVLTPGIHVFAIGARGITFEIDKVVLVHTDEDAQGYAPSGYGPDETLP